MGKPLESRLPALQDEPPDAAALARWKCRVLQQ